MEGVIDHSLRDLLTSIGGIDRCVTEFVRITDQRLPDKVFYRLCPELKNQGVTPNGVPVYVQLLGGKPGPMAENAAVAARLGALGIDINFGCPAKTVNKNDGGSILLREPHRVHDIAHAVRTAVPTPIPVTAKIRLGFDDDQLFHEICEAVIDAGINELTIHARTRRDGYKPPAYWQHIAPIKRQNEIPVIANGEVWTVADHHRCLEQSACHDVMLGRGMLACPDLARQIKQHHQGQEISPLKWHDILELLEDLLQKNLQLYPEKYAGNRIKQWLVYLKFHYLPANFLFEAIKRLHRPEQILNAIQVQRVSCKTTQAA